MHQKKSSTNVLFKVFLCISILGFLILGCTVDVAADGLQTYIYLVCGWFICVFITAVLYDYRIFARRIYAICKSLKVIHGYLHKIRTPEYIDLYEDVIGAGSLLRFYEDMLKDYDWYHQREAK